ncbi:amino acid permease [Arthrobacter sp. MYb227]|uniref:APC family permease n=1 Tax=Arthrobacter sp. MYb227 TaxID=1848601 RepID=UPI000CFE2358|nr:APC family permease [Arthrobacter sp. MYb227]PQZ93653.1 amino acid permease [Arthrobacter sp. MYb227]
MSDPTQRQVLSTRKVVFLVIAAAAPMGAMVGNVPLALTRTNGIGLPAAFVLAAVILLCFSEGYGAMNARVVNSGAFYTYIARAMGKPAGAAGAYAAFVGYTSMALGIGTAFGYFTHLVFAGLGLSVPWFVFTACGSALVGFLGYRSAELSVKVLGVLMVLEFAILIIFNIAVVGTKGVAAFPIDSFAPNQAFSSTLGIALLFALTSFIGFESAAIYGEESKNPERTVPRAMYISVASISAFYVITAWIIIGAAGGLKAPAMAESQLGDLVFTLAKDYGGEALYSATAVLLCTSILASYLALHNAASRYLFALGREQMMPRVFGGFHARHLRPHIASLTITAFTVLILGFMALLGVDPYTVIAAGFVGLGTRGIIFVQAITAVAVLMFFWKREDRSLWRGIIAPAIGALGLGAGFILATLNYPTLTGSDSAWVNLVPLLLPLVAIIGVFVSLRQRQSNPEAYANFAASVLRTSKEESSTHAHTG